jgi:DNA repair exonuclease SbcCD ATPase subunit
MPQPVRILEIRNHYVSELKEFESELSKQLNEVRTELSRLNPALKGEHSSGAIKKGSNNTVSILAGKVCPKCGKKGHDLRRHRWDDKKAIANGRKKAS